MLPPFQIRNLRPSQPRATTQDSLIRISAPGYDKAISSHPAAKLKYQDEDDGDTITVGSSTELAQRLDEPASRKTRYQQHSSRNPMAIATLLSEAQQSPPSLTNHVFDIEDREEIRRLWQDIQEKNSNILGPLSPTCATKATAPWKQSEDELLLKLRGSGIEWADIQRLLPGCAAFPCLHKQSTWNKDKNGEFNKAYSRLRADIWGPIAREIGVTWGEAEAMFRKSCEIRPAPTALMASSDPHIEKHVFVNTSNGESPTNSAVRSKPSSPPVPRLSNCNSDQDTAEHRVHQFESTTPPKIQSGNPAWNKGSGTRSSHAQPYDPVRSDSIGALPCSLHTSHAVNLTQEGRRQAQAAGDKLRARRTPSRHRRMAMAVKDHTGHQNRWASYKSQSSMFLAQEPTNVSEGFEGHTLTSEGRRQAQVAGDKLRCRTNPIRHSRPSRGSISDHGISKNRWSSYGLRTARLDERPDMKLEVKEKTPSGQGLEQEPGGQPSLLAVFEAELAKKMTMDASKGGARTPAPEAAAATMSTSEKTPQLNDSSDITAPEQSRPLPKKFNPLLDGLEAISDHLEGLTVRDEVMYQELPQAIGQGFRAAIGGLGTFVRGLRSGLQEASDLTRHAAEHTREFDHRTIDDTSLGLRGVAGDVTASGQGMFQRQSETDQPKEEPSASFTAGFKDSTSPKCSEEVTRPSIESKATLSDGKVADEESHNVSTRGPPQPTPASRSKAGPKAIKIGQGRSPRVVSDIPVTITRNPAPDSRRMSRNLGIDRVPRYHKPGPIHLPSHASLAQTSPMVGGQSVAPRMGYVDHLRRYNSPEHVNEVDMIQSTNIPAAAARFPTLAQFEGQDFTPNVPFPPLPSMSMEPLIPLKAKSRSESKELIEDSQLLGQKQNDCESEASADPNVTDQQRKFLGSKKTTIRGSPGPNFTSAPTPMQLHDAGSSMNHALTEYQAHLMLEEQIRRQKLLMAIQGSEQIAPGRAKSDTQSIVEPQALSSSAHISDPYVSEASNADLNPKNRQQDCQTQSMSDQQGPLQSLSTTQDSAPVVNMMNGVFMTPSSFQYRRNSSGRLMQVPVFRLEHPEARFTNNPFAGSADNSTAQDHQTPTHEINAKQEKKAHSFEEKVTRSVIADDVEVSGALPKTTNMKRNDMVGQQDEEARNYRATHPDSWFNTLPSVMTKKESLDRLSSAARLAEPFDPLEAEPSARRHLTEGIRRNATVAGTDSRHNARHRRPYSEAFDGNGRVEWDMFLQRSPAPQPFPRPFSLRPLSRESWTQNEATAVRPQTQARASSAVSEDANDDWRGTPPALHTRDQDFGLAVKYHDDEEPWAINPCEVDPEHGANVGERKRSLSPSMTARLPGLSSDDHKERKALDNGLSGKSFAYRRPPRGSGILFKDRDEENKIYNCVKRLRDLGFDHADDDGGPEGRLLQYASAAGGDLVAAIDMIDEEQRAYREREDDALKFIGSV